MGKVFSDGEWLDRYQRFHAASDGTAAGLAALPTNDERGLLPAGEYLAGNSFRAVLSEFYNAFRQTQTVGTEDYIVSSLRFIHEQPWTRPTNQPIDAVAVEEAIAHATGRGLVLEFGAYAVLIFP